MEQGWLCAITLYHFSKAGAVRLSFREPLTQRDEQGFFSPGGTSSSLDDGRGYVEREDNRMFMSANTFICASITKARSPTDDEPREMMIQGRC